ncbi:MAG: hypothetical protein ABR499_12525 [Gemmatimonadaceae bacterium]
MSTIRLRVLLAAATGLAQLACADAVGLLGAGLDLDIVVPGMNPTSAKAGRPGQAPGTALADVLATDDGTSAPATGDGSTEPTSGESTSEIPPEFQVPPTIKSYHSDAGFGPSTAWGQAGMRYEASHAKQTVALSLRFNYSPVATASATDQRSDWWPATRDLFTSTQISIGKDCGHSADARGEHTAWHKLPIPLGTLSEFGHTTQSSNKAAAQSPCAPDSGGGSGGGGGGTGVYVCYCLDYYSPVTGEWEHGGIIYCLEA